MHAKLHSPLRTSSSHFPSPRTNRDPRQCPPLLPEFFFQKQPHLLLHPVQSAQSGYAILTKHQFRHHRVHLIRHPHEKVDILNGDRARKRLYMNILQPGAHKRGMQPVYVVPVAPVGHLHGEMELEVGREEVCRLGREGVTDVHKEGGVVGVPGREG